jgi:hypothetical protein
MRQPGRIRTPAQQFGLAVLILAGVLMLFFHGSFLSGQVLFANDAPPGALRPHSVEPWSNFRGAWLDANWVGSAAVSALPTFTNLLFALVCQFLSLPIYFKLYAPTALLTLGLAVWLCFRRLGFRAEVCVLGAMAAWLNSDPLSYACWGLATLPLGMAATFLALAAVASGSTGRRLPKLILAGFAVGLSVMETYDNGAIFSLYVAAFALFQAWGEAGGPATKVVKGLGRVALIALCSALVATQAIDSLIATQVKGIAGMAQDRATKLQRWHEATQWSLPKLETLRLVIPGLFGYRLDTPDGGNYWGRVGRDPAWDDYLAQPNPDPARTPPGYLRHSGSGFYAGVFVVLVALWATAQAFRKQRSPLTDEERRAVRFWSVAALASLLLAFGRHAPFYQILYALPYSSTIRNPVKFLHPLNLSLIILFGYGLNALWRSYVMPATPKLPAIPDQLRSWWKSGAAADRRWVTGMIAALVASLVSWLIYAGSKAELVRYLAVVGFGSGPLSDRIASASIHEVGWFVLFLALSVGLLGLILSGVWSGKRAKWAGVAAGLLLVADLGRANTPWRLYYDYQAKYATNPVIEFLRQTPYEQRVIGLFLPWGNEQAQKLQDPLQEIYQIEWAQHHFQYYRIQSLDIVQMARMGEDTLAYKKTLGGAPVRLWELTNTRYLLALAGAVEPLNLQLDPAKKRFRLHTAFSLQQDQPGGPILTVTNTTGPYGLIEFTGALPRARLFPRWQVSTNDATTLTQLASPDFDPAETVLVSNELPPAPTPATNASAGRVEFEQYAPKAIRLRAENPTPSVLLLNDHYHPDWRVFVDGRAAPLLRCNYIMRGVYLEPGRHTVEFRFQPSATALYVSLAAIAIGVALLGVLAFAKGSATPGDPRPGAGPSPVGPRR